MASILLQGKKHKRRMIEGRPSVGLHPPDILNKGEKYIFYLTTLSVVKVT